MKSKIVMLNGEYIPEIGEADPNVVAQLEDMLEQAKAGRIHCIAGAFDTPDGVRWYNVGIALGFDMVGGLFMVQQHIAELMKEE